MQTKLHFSQVHTSHSFRFLLMPYPPNGAPLAGFSEPQTLLPGCVQDPPHLFPISVKDANPPQPDVQRRILLTHSSLHQSQPSPSQHSWREVFITNLRKTLPTDPQQCHQRGISPSHHTGLRRALGNPCAFPPTAPSPPSRSSSALPQNSALHGPQKSPPSVRLRHSPLGKHCMYASFPALTEGYTDIYL